eukprot:SAG31_NODE_1058_length_10121_cov_14.446617_4_plen_90_part_00
MAADGKFVRFCRAGGIIRDGMFGGAAGTIWELDLANSDRCTPRNNSFSRDHRSPERVQPAGTLHLPPNVLMGLLNCVHYCRRTGEGVDT